MENRLPRPADHTVVRDFFHNLHDTLVLLGASANVADLVERPEAITAADVDDLRNFNGKLIAETKWKLVNLNTLAVEVVT